MSQWMGNLVTLLILGAALMLFLKMRSSGATPEPPVQAPKPPASAPPVPAPVIPESQRDEEDENLIAVITAAISAFTGSGEIRVIHIRQTSANWKQAGRQDAMNSRLV